MKLFIRRLQADWASWLAVAFIALLPFSRLAEIPLSVFAISLAFLARSKANRARIRAASAFVLPLFLCYWVPMVLSSFDSFDPQKSWTQTAAALRYLAAALAMACPMTCMATSTAVFSSRKTTDLSPGPRLPALAVCPSAMQVPCTGVAAGCRLT